MSKVQSKFKNRYLNAPQVSGQLFKKKSMTIPGQELTPQELVRRYQSGLDIPKQFFMEQNVSSFERMSVFDKIDYLKQLRESNHNARHAITAQIKDYQRQAELQKLAEAQKQKQVDDKVNVTTI